MMTTSARDVLIEDAISYLVSDENFENSDIEDAAGRVASLLYQAWQQEPIYLTRIMPMILHQLLAKRIFKPEPSQKPVEDTLILPISRSFREVLLHGMKFDQERRIFYTFGSCVTGLMMQFRREWTERCKLQTICRMDAY